MKGNMSEQDELLDLVEAQLRAAENTLGNRLNAYLYANSVDSYEPTKESPPPRLPGWLGVRHRASLWLQRHGLFRISEIVFPSRLYKKICVPVVISGLDG